MAATWRLLDTTAAVATAKTTTILEGKPTEFPALRLRLSQAMAGCPCQVVDHEEWWMITTNDGNSTHP